MANTPTASSTQTLQTQQIVGSLLSAMSAYTPEGIQASAAELQKQLQITDRMQADYDAAKQTIAQAQDVTVALDARASTLSEAEKSLGQQRQSLAAASASLDNRIADFNSNEAALNRRKLFMESFADGMDARETVLNTRENGISAKERAVAQRESAVAAKEALLESLDTILGRLQTPEA